MKNSILDQIPFDPAYIMVGLLILVVLLLILTITIMTKVGGLDRQYDYLVRGKNARTLEDVILSQVEKVGDLRAEGGSSRDSVRTLSRSQRASSQKHGLVKYNTFKGMGGNLSSVFAMLNYTNNGFVLNCVHSREDCYLYIKVVGAGQTDIILGNEGQETLEQILDYIKKS